MFVYQGTFKYCLFMLLCMPVFGFAQTSSYTGSINSLFKVCEKSVLTEHPNNSDESKDLNALRIIAECKQSLSKMDMKLKARFLNKVQRTYDHTLYSLIYRKMQYDKITNKRLEVIRNFQELFMFSVNKYDLLKKISRNEEHESLFDEVVEIIFSTKYFDTIQSEYTNRGLMHYFNPLAWAKLYFEKESDLVQIEKVYQTVINLKNAEQKNDSVCMSEGSQKGCMNFSDIASMQTFEKVKAIIAQEGSLLKDMTFKSLAGEEISLSRVFTDDEDLKAIIVAFWATSCGGCKKSFPLLNSIQDNSNGSYKVFAVAQSRTFSSLLSRSEKGRLTEVNKQSYYKNHKSGIERFFSQDKFSNIDVAKYYLSSFAYEKKALNSYPITALPHVYIIYRNGQTDDETITAGTLSDAYKKISAESLEKSTNHLLQLDAFGDFKKKLDDKIMLAK